MTDVFSDQLHAWRDYTVTPWGRIRYAVVADVLRRQCTALGEPQIPAAARAVS